MPVAVEAGDVRFDGQSIGLDPRGAPNGAARLFARPYEVTIVKGSDAAALKGVVKRVHGLGPARRVEVALGGERSETVVEVDAPRSQDLRVGEAVGLRPQQYRLFPVNSRDARQ